MAPLTELQQSSDLLPTARWGARLPGTPESELLRRRWSKSELFWWATKRRRAAATEQQLSTSARR
ncbi:MAG: hypothetical protein Q9204_003109 [Flavoplaca sp. TL-2023a]